MFNELITDIGASAIQLLFGYLFGKFRERRLHKGSNLDEHDLYPFDLDDKNSTDIKITPKDIKLPDNEIFKEYFHSLYSCYQDYVTEWPFLATFAENLQISGFNLQRYQSGQHFQKLHTERSSLATLHRVFAWMTYLNDVDQGDGGSTLFSHYDLAIQPRKGLTLIWPAEWTHAHKGNVLKANNKYIITGWMTFPNNQNSLQVRAESSIE